MYGVWHIIDILSIRRRLRMGNFTIPVDRLGKKHRNLAKITKEEVKIKKKMVHLTLAAFFTIFLLNIQEEYTMEQENTVAASAPVSSFMTRATNVFMSPGELYAEVAQAPPQTTSWLLPFMLSIVMALVITVALFNNPTLRQQIYDMQEKGMKKAVAEGKMTQENADRASEAMESSGPVMFIAIGGTSAVFIVAAIFFGVSLLLWLAGKYMMAMPGGYKKMLEVFGLASLIGVLGSIITLLLMNVMNSFYASPSGALLVLDSFDSANKMHRLLSSLNIFTVWEMAIVGLGMSRISGKSVGTGMGISLGLWAVWTVCSVLFGWGMR